MDYEEKYKIALERAKAMIKVATNQDEDIAFANTIFPELVESEDERIRKDLIEYFKGISKYSIHKRAEMRKVWIAWLEKQGNKPQGKSALEAIKEEKTDNSNKVVKTRFKESDWITNGENTIQITMVDTKSGHSGYYRCFEGSHGFGWYVIDIESADKNYHLWTIADAKQGDVLAGFYGIFIFMGESDGYCGVLSDNTFIRSTGYNEWTEDLHPATKEQRNLLFQKMKEKGWEWDAEKKELKKIETIDIPFSAKDNELIEATYFIPEGFYAEIVDNKVIIKKGKQKSANKVEPKFKFGYRVRNKKSSLEQTLGSCIEDVYEGAFPFRIKDQDEWELVEQKPTDTYCKENCKGYQETGKCYADGSCDAKIKAEQKPAWSEEDEKLTNRIEAWLDTLCDYLKDSSPECIEDVKDVIEQLKSLKQRYTWKPTEEQIQA